MSGQATRESILKEIRAIRVGQNQQLRQVRVPEKAYKNAREFLKWAPNSLDCLPIRFKKLCYLPDNDNIYGLLISNAGDTPLGKAKEKLQEWQTATTAFIRYALNLLLAPSRPEFLRMKLSTSFYIYQVSKKLKDAEKILVCMGYECSTGPHEVQEYKYAGEVKTEQIAEVLTDLVILHTELDLLQGIVQGAIHENYVNVQLCDILKARAHPHEDLGVALQSSAREAHRRLLARVHPQLVGHHHHHHYSPPLLPPQHGLSGMQYPGSGQQFHQATGTASQPQNQWSPNPSSQMNRGAQNIPPSVYQSQSNLGYLPQTVPQHRFDNFHQNKDPYQNMRSGTQALYTPQQQLSGDALNREVKPQYGKGLDKDILKTGTENVAGETAKDPYNCYKGYEKEGEQQPQAPSKPPNPMDLPEPVFQDTVPVVNYPADVPSSGNLSLMIYSRSVQSDLSGPNLDSMLSNERSLDTEFHIQEHGPGYNVQGSENISGSTHYSQKHDEVETPTAGEKHVPFTRESQNKAIHPYCNLELRDGQMPVIHPQSTSCHGETNKINSQEASNTEVEDKISRKPVPAPRMKKMSREECISEMKHTETSHVHAHGSILTSTEIIGSEQTEHSKPRSSPHPSLESDSAPPSIGAEHGQPGSGPQSTEESPTSFEDIKLPTDDKAPQSRERSNAINLGTQIVSTSPWVCEYCTNLNSGGTIICEICRRDRVYGKETTV